MPSLEKALAALDQSREAALDRLFALLRLPSISAKPDCAEACAQTAQFLVEQLTEIGFDASARKTPGHPIVVAKARAAEASTDATDELADAVVEAEVQNA